MEGTGLPLHVLNLKGGHLAWCCWLRWGSPTQKAAVWCVSQRAEAPCSAPSAATVCFSGRCGWSRGTGWWVSPWWRAKLCWRGGLKRWLQIMSSSLSQFVCWSPNSSYLWNMTLFGDRILKLNGWALIQYDWCPCKRRLGHRHAQMDGWCENTARRWPSTIQGLGRNQPCWHIVLGLVASRNGNTCGKIGFLLFKPRSWCYFVNGSSSQLRQQSGLLNI